MSFIIFNQQRLSAARKQNTATSAILSRSSNPMTIPKLIFAIISSLLFSCGQPTDKLISDKTSSENTAGNEDYSSKNKLQDTTVQILWRDDKYDEELKDTFNTIIVNEAYCKTLPDAARAAVGYVATFIGNECWWDGEAKKDRSNLKCKILSALDLGYQCSDRHLGFLRQWFRGDKKALHELQNCPTTPYTATIQDSFDEIKLTVKGDQILLWFSATGVNVREGETWSWTETDHFQVDHDKVMLITVDKSKVEHGKFTVGE